MKTIIEGEGKNTTGLKYLGEFQISDLTFTAAGISSQVPAPHWHQDVPLPHFNP